MNALFLAAMLLGPTARPGQPGPSDTLTLVQAVRMGRERGVSATLARLNAKIADLRVGQRRADLLPNLSGGITAARQTINLDEFGFPVPVSVTDPFSVFRLQVRVSQTIYDPVVFARLAAARDSTTAAGLDAETAGVLSGATAGVAFLRALSADETVLAREADSAIAGRLLGQAKRLLEAGVTPAIDQTRSEVNASAVRSQLVVARNQRDRARLDLARALDLPPTTSLQLSNLLEASDGTLPTNSTEAVGFALAHRSELKAEQERQLVQARARQAIRAENLPSVVASGAYTESGRSTGGLKGTYLAQLGVSIPIFDGLRRQLRSQEQGFRIEAQEIRIKDLTAQIESEARQALLDLASSAEQVALAKERVRLADLELGQAEDRFKAGVAGTIETTNAQGSVIGAHDALIQARVALGIARINAYRALGILEQLP